uniref:Ras GEF n=1 Tax=Moniliophthora roreri TaxID=221103 RepID=A0A0W0G3J5_MONRR
MTLPVDQSSSPPNTIQTDSQTLPIPSDLRDAYIAPRSPVPSFASKDSFLTAVSTPSVSDFDSPIPISNPASLLSPQPQGGLRKSVSVDSFVHYPREPYSSVATRPNRGHTGSALEPPRGLLSSFKKGLDNQFIGNSRERGASVSSVKDGYQSSIAEDSDVERSDIIIDRYKHTSLKGQDHTRPFLRAGELPLPSRTPTLSTTSSMSSIMTASTSSSTQEGRPITQSQSLQSIPRQAPVVSGRTRSGSLGVYAPSSGRRMHINTHTATDQNHAVTLVVVGTAGCGKSVAIRKGLKNYDLSEPSTPLPGANSSIRYTRRVGRVAQEDGSDCPLNVIEVDITDSMLESSISPVDNLPEALKVDGVIICYDASVESSFTPVEDLLRGYRNLQLPVIVIACKSDLDRQVDPETAAEVLQQYDAGLVEVNSGEAGREKMKRSFDWILKAVVRDRRSLRNRFEDNRNPASPELISSPHPLPSVEGSRTATPTVSSTNQAASSTHPQRAAIPAHEQLNAPTSPSRVRSTGDLISEQEKLRMRESQLGESDVANTIAMRSNSADSLHESRHIAASSVNGERPNNEKVENKEKESRSAQWATLDELLDKLLFLAVSGDDPTYITHFLLTYRRFASPRSVLLAMQKRMRQLDNPSGDPIFACYAQMRICHLLELWIGDYDYDFSVRGTAGALSALIKSIISKTYLLHYGSDFLPLLELLPTLVDRDVAWALKVDDIADESDDSYSLLEDDDESVRSEIKPHSPPASPPKHKSSVNPARERKSSLPLSAKSLFPGSATSSSNDDPDSLDFHPKQQLRELLKLANEVHATDSEEIAQEITRIEKKLFLEIKPRHWLQYTFVSGRKDPETDPIARFNQVSNHLADWVCSLILCHDNAKSRARQIEKLVEIAQRLRALNNYSALRAFVAGINGSTYPGDPTMERFKARSPEQAKNLQSWDVLLQHIRAHRAYRLALRNTKGACIPALEVHMSDLIRAHEGNDDFNSSDPTKIHWGKFNMMGRFITSTTQCQIQCQTTTDYNFPERSHISSLLMSKYVMDDEMQKTRIAPDADFDEPSNYSGSSPIGGPPSRIKDPVRLRRLFGWTSST